jgi:atypical dual specificity phosphatase
MSDFTWIIDDRLGATSLPSFPEDFEELRVRGISALISLTESSPDSTYLSAFGIDLHRFPIPDMSIVSVETMDEILAKIHEEIAFGKKTAVHCGAGLGRTGLVIACYLVSQGESGEESILRVRRLRPGSIETKEQERFILDYYRRVKKRSRNRGRRKG